MPEEKKVRFAEEPKLEETKEYYLSEKEKKWKVPEPETLSPEQKLEKQELEEQKLEKQESKKQKLEAKIKAIIPKSLKNLLKKVASKLEKKSSPFNRNDPKRENAIRRKKSNDISI